MANFICSFSSIPRTTLDEVKYYVNVLGESISLEQLTIDNIDVALCAINDGQVEWTIDRKFGVGLGDTLFVVCSSTSKPYMRSLRKTVKDTVSYEELKRLDDLCDKYDKYAGYMLFAGNVESIEDSPERIVYAKLSPILTFENPVPSSDFTSFISMNNYGSMTPISGDECSKLLTIIRRYNSKVDLSIIDKQPNKKTGLETRLSTVPNKSNNSVTIERDRGLPKMLPEQVQEQLETEYKTIEDYINIHNLEGADRIAVVKVRVNQGAFREVLIRKYGKCCLCGLDENGLLVASHIKPWSDCTPKEKLDDNNGLLLCPNHDKLFDRGYISFTNNGNIMISNALSKENQLSMNINSEMHIIMSDKTKEYMKYHREKVFLNI